MAILKSHHHKPTYCILATINLPMWLMWLFIDMQGELDDLYQPVYPLNNKIFKVGQNTDISASET